MLDPVRHDGSEWSTPHKRNVGLVAAAVWLLGALTAAHGQGRGADGSVLQFRQVSATRASCDCGQWTCPMCQQDCDCPIPGLGAPGYAVPPEQRGAGTEGYGAAVEPGAGPMGQPSTGDVFGQPSTGLQPSPEQLAATSPGLPAGFGSTGAGYSGAPNMIGDFLGAGQTSGIFPAPNESLQRAVIPGGPGAVVGRLKIAENVSPIPRTRIFTNYSLFDNVPLTSNGVSINRFTPGFEQAFCNQMYSIELRAPFAATLNSDISIFGGRNDLSNFEFGDLFLAFKGVLLSSQRSIISAGLSLSLPTADDLVISSQNRTTLARIKNDSVHIMPFLGWLAVSQDQRWFTQGFLQIDVDANGDPVLLNPFFNGLQPVGRLQSATFLYFDAGLGYWLVPPSPGSGRVINGFAPTVELHYNRSLQETDVVQAGAVRIGEPQEDIQILDLIVGSTTLLHNRSMVTVGYGTPIGNGADQAFDGELRVLWNRFF